MNITQLIVCLLGCPLATAQLGMNSSGNIGLATINTPEQLGRGHKIVGLFTRYSKHGLNDPRGEVGEFISSLGYGINDLVEIGVLLRLVSIHTGELALAKPNLSGKFNILRSPRLLFSVISNLQLPMQKAERHVRTSHAGGQIELASKFKFSRMNLYFNTGIGRKDHIDRALANRSLAELVSEGFLLLSGGLSYQSDFPTVLFVEGLGRRSLKNGHGAFYFQIGLISSLNKRMIIKASAGFGLPDPDVADTGQVAVLGVSYLLGSL